MTRAYNLLPNPIARGIHIAEALGGSVPLEYRKQTPTTLWPSVLRILAPSCG